MRLNGQFSPQIFYINRNIPWDVCSIYSQIHLEMLLNNEKSKLFKVDKTKTDLKDLKNILEF